MDRRDVALLAEPPSMAAKAERSLAGRESYAATELDASRQLTLGIIHEMNNALGGVAVLSEIYQSTAAGDEGLIEGLGLIHKGVGRLQALVRHLKILNGPTSAEPTYINLTEYVRSQFEMFAPLLPKTVRVETTFPSEELPVHLDETVLRRVLLNLVLNLRDALVGQPGTPRALSVGLRRRADKAEVILSSDQSVGLEDTDLSAEAEARVANAHRRLREAGGTVIAYPGGGCVLTLPLAF